MYRYQSLSMSEGEYALLCNDLSQEDKIDSEKEMLTYFTCARQKVKACLSYYSKYPNYFIILLHGRCTGRGSQNCITR